MTKQMRVGIDFGNTIARKVDGIQTGFPGAFTSILSFVREGIPVYIVSKVNERQKVEVSDWLNSNDFFRITGVPKENLLFCEHRHQKGNIAIQLGLTHHVDDRPEVMVNMPVEVRKYLFCPQPEEVVEYFNRLSNTAILTDWKMVYDAIHFEWKRYNTNEPTN